VGTIRLCLRLSTMLCWAAIMLAIRMSFWPLARFDEARDRRWRRFWFRHWARGHMWLFGARVETRGTPPTPPFYLVANHLSYMDIFLISAHTGCGFVARGDMANWPILGTACRSLYILFIDRTSRKDAARVNDLITHTLAMGDGITVFPESRISRGIDVEPFKSALIQPAVAANTPVHYVTITYRTPEGARPANEVVGWWRPEPLFYHVKRLLRQPGFTATIHFGAAPLSGLDRKSLSKSLHDAVRSQFVPVDSPIKPT